MKCNEVIIPTFCSIRITYLITGGPRTSKVLQCRWLIKGSRFLGLLDVSTVNQQWSLDSRYSFYKASRLQYKEWLFGVNQERSNQH